MTRIMPFPAASYDEWKTRSDHDEDPSHYEADLDPDNAPPAYCWLRAYEYWVSKGSPESVADRYEAVMGIWCGLPSWCRAGDEPIPHEVWRLVHPDARPVLDDITAFAKSGGFDCCPEIPEIEIV